MKYANKLTHKELRELYQLFTDSDATIKELNITKDEYSIGLEGVIEFPEYDEEYLKDNPNATISTDDVTIDDVPLLRRYADIRNNIIDELIKEIQSRPLVNYF